MESQAIFPTEDQLTNFSAINLIKNRNQFTSPSATGSLQIYHHYALDFPTDELSNFQNFSLPPTLSSFHPYAHYAVSSPRLVSDFFLTEKSFLTPSPIFSKKSRGEKKSVPDYQKDDRYYERRKKNNQAAKKSRDAKKFREDQIALRATILEHENTILRAQVLTLKEETQALRQFIVNDNKKIDESVFSDKEFENSKLYFFKKWKNEVNC